MNNWVDSKTLAMGTGVASGVGLTAYTTGMLTATAYGLSAPVIVGGILGLLPTQYLAVPLHRKYGSILRNSRNLETFCHFTIRATTAMLGAWIGLAATSFLFHLTINPFTLPALITAGISASIILGLYLYASSYKEEQYGLENDYVYHTGSTSTASRQQEAYAVPLRTGVAGEKHSSNAQQTSNSSLVGTRGTLYNHSAKSSIYFAATPAAMTLVGNLSRNADVEVLRMGTTNSFTLRCAANNVERYQNQLLQIEGVIVSVDNPAEFSCDY